MRFLAVAALLAALSSSITVLAAHAEGCLDLTQDHPHDPTIAASKRKGNLFIKLNKATNLSDKDLFGSSDPFIEMWLDKNYKQRSKDTKGTNPVFNETFCFYVLPGQDKLYVKAVDWDALVNDKIGQATIPLSNVFQNGKDGPRDYNLPKWLGLSSNGVVNMQMQYQEDYSS
ncbi:hypothetical protein EMPS_02455 [Entomortierella parvispora]|uniref:C2 domain-containing protein n=1 Tax=Entomortierella parvispora TaxID=205924 RepID=A0A9P3LTH8_9FUNG|nr:hypothetical protein EMPS_02455 [Entomortierella parvispora]